MVKENKIQVSISGEARREIEDLGKRLNLSSASDVIRSSLKLAQFIEHEMETGNEIIIRNKKTKREKEIIRNN